MQSAHDFSPPPGSTLAAGAAGRLTTPLRVASWPGPGERHNPFVTLFLDGLAAAGCEVEGLEEAGAVAACLRRPDPPDIVLLHWAERIFGEKRNRWQALAGIARLVRALGRRGQVGGRRTRVVWLVHNLAPHDARPFQRLVWPAYVRALSRRVDGVLTLSPATLAEVRRALPGLAARPGLGLWHPAYPGAAGTPAERQAARADLGWDETRRVFGYCGQIRPYKGVEELLAAFVDTPGADLRLLLAGLPRPADFAARLTAMAAGDPRVALRFGNLSPEAFRAALAACDLVVAPFRDYLHSGSIVHALSAGRPVLTPETAFSNDLRGVVGADWLRGYRGALTPAVLAGAMAAPLPDLAPQPDLALLDGARVGAEAAAFLRGLSAG